MGKLKCFGSLSGLLATVPVNPKNGANDANGSNVGGVNTGTIQALGVSSEVLSTYEGTSRTGTQFFAC